ncbi:MAG: glycosyltransferase [Bacteroidia bacterium]
MLKAWIVVVLLLNLYYVVQFVYSYLGLKSLPKITTSAKHVNRFSIVVAMRNEANNLQNLFKSIHALNYPKSQYELVLVDDFSDDQSVQIAQKLVIEHPDLNVQIISLSNEGLKHNRAFKKTAIQFGVANSKYNWIVTTDADCVYRSGYLSMLDAFIEKHEPKFISAPVELTPANTLFQKMQALEFKGLVALGAAYIQRDKPFLCNGANLAFTRQVFLDLNGYKGFEHIESGDDVWFMHKVQERFPFELFFALDKELIVSSSPCQNAKAFINQRKRWTSKNTEYKKVSQLITLSVDYLFYCAILLNLILGLFFNQLLNLAVFMMVSKALVELNLYLTFNKYVKTRGWFFTYLITFPVQLFYVILIYPLSQFTKFKWKNRVFNA